MERLKKQEQEKKEQAERARTEIVDYFKDMKILDYFLASVKQCRYNSPLLSCAAMFDGSSNKLALHFSLFHYKPSYISMFTKNPHDFPALLSSRQTAIECIYPQFVGNQLSQDYSTVMSRRRFLTMTPSFIGAAHLNLKEVTSVMQVGEDISEEGSVYFAVLGVDLEGKQSLTVLEVSFDKGHFDITFQLNYPLTDILQDDSHQGETITRALISQGSSQADRVPVMLVQTSANRFLMSRIQITNELFKLDKPTECQSIAEGERLAAVSNGIACLQNGQNVRTFAIDQALFDRVQASLKTKALTQAEQGLTNLMNEDQVLGL